MARTWCAVGTPSLAADHPCRGCHAVRRFAPNELIAVAVRFGQMLKSTEPYAIVADDDPIILLDASDILRDAGFRPLEAADAEEALNHFSAHEGSVALLFTDVDMPGKMDGFQLATRVNDLYPDVEIIVASGRRHPRPGDLPAKATFLSKPFSSQMVHEHLREKLPDGKKPEPLRKAV